MSLAYEYFGPQLLCSLCACLDIRCRSAACTSLVLPALPQLPHRWPCTACPASTTHRCAVHRMPCTVCPAPNALHSMPCTTCLAPHALHSMPCTACPAQHAVHPLPPAESASHATLRTQLRAAGATAKEHQPAWRLCHERQHGASQHGGVGHTVPMPDMSCHLNPVWGSVGASQCSPHWIEVAPFSVPGQTEMSGFRPDVPGLTSFQHMVTAFGESRSPTRNSGYAEGASAPCKLESSWQQQAAAS
jgi:hypothetical protein